MKTKIISLIVMLSFSSYAFSTTIIVDKNGGGSFTSIQTAITNSSTNDTIKVWPGTYVEQITLNKNITIIGSGYENTTITSSSNPTINMSSGKILHFKISSLTGDGIWLHNGIVSNCLVTACSLRGIYAGTAGDNGLVQNCIISYNGSNGILAGTGGISVTNCIARPNGAIGFARDYYGTFNLSYSNGSTSSTSGNQGVINIDPQFVSAADYHISEGSPCWNTGNSALSDPDGSVSDMGYFGGPDCPIYPVVYEIIISPNGNNINLQAKGRANY
jgi:hypothetical protein